MRRARRGHRLHRPDRLAGAQVVLVLVALLVAAFTDAGIVLGAVAALYASGGERSESRATRAAAAGGAALALSIPLQFAADGELSRAVWWHNLRYAR